METVDPLAKSEKGDLADGIEQSCISSNTLTSFYFLSADVETTVSGMRPQSTVCGLLKQSELRLTVIVVCIHERSY